MKQEKIRIRYCGRFAPSPSGPLHFGSIVTAVGSFLEACTQGGKWLVRIEDVDVTRIRPGMDSLILRTLENHGFVWTGEVVYQHCRIEAYRAALDDLCARKHVYECLCSRKEMGLWPVNSEGEPVYPGICRHKGLNSAAGSTRRLNVQDAVISFCDATYGIQVSELAREAGDFVLQRKDGLYAYQLAVVVDDDWQQITHVVRGSDLLTSTGRQIFLQKALDFPVPAYRHLPVVLNSFGKKLSKQNLAQPVEPKRESQTLCRALSFLGQDPPDELGRARVEDVWTWARSNWNPSRIPLYKQARFP
ncbi:MAG: tRNA glutamyl-Q(34) synthetase GluQRS [Pseudomonadota bacterium]|nr:tRNA glutamyl-Q(34) synthetase GluQRS [Pseudomonadota bacterium]